MKIAAANTTVNNKKINFHDRRKIKQDRRSNQHVY